MFTVPYSNRTTLTFPASNVSRNPSTTDARALADRQLPHPDDEIQVADLHVVAHLALECARISRQLDAGTATASTRPPERTAAEGAAPADAPLDNAPTAC